MRIPEALIYCGLIASCVASPPGQTGNSEAALSNTQESAFNYFVSKGLSPSQAAGVVGNLIQESSVTPTAIESDGGAGRGIAQWSVDGRWDTDADDNENWFSNNKHNDPWSLDGQLDFTWFELTTFPRYGLAALRDTTNVASATVEFETDFEGCGNCAEDQRIEYARQVLAAFGADTTDDPSTCYSSTLDTQMPNDACVQSASDEAWYQCEGGAWVDRWSDPSVCNGEYPL